MGLISLLFQQFVLILLAFENGKPLYFCIIGRIRSHLLNEDSNVVWYLLSTYYVPVSCVRTCYIWTHVLLPILTSSHCHSSLNLKASWTVKVSPSESSRARTAAKAVGLQSPTPNHCTHQSHASLHSHMITMLHAWCTELPQRLWEGSCPLLQADSEAV